MKLYLGIFAALAVFSNSQCEDGGCSQDLNDCGAGGCAADGDCGVDNQPQLQMKSIAIDTPTKSKRPYTIENCPYCNKRGCRWC